MREFHCAINDNNRDANVRIILIITKMMVTGDQFPLSPSLRDLFPPLSIRPVGSS
jgi:hypothetical protein